MNRPRRRTQVALVECQAIQQRRDGAVQIGDRAVARDLQLEISGPVSDRDLAVAHLALGGRLEGRLDHPVGDQVDPRGQVDGRTLGVLLTGQPQTLK
jgi:hypothetical protein